MNKDKATLRSSGIWSTILLGTAALMLVISVVSAPEPAFQASLHALKLWWNIVFPALLPFLVLVEMINAYGWSHGMGVLLEPMMRKIFHLPGSGGTVLITGMIAGFPAAAQLSAEMVKNNELTAAEAGRLTAMAHFCNPMTILVVIGGGLLHQPEAGYFLLAIHWISGLLAAWTYSPKSKNTGRANLKRSIYTSMAVGQQKGTSLLLQAAKAAARARSRDGRSFGKLLGESVTRSVQTLMMTGGFIMIFAVMVNVLSDPLSSNIIPFIAAGLLEVHIGSQSITEGIFTSPGLQLSLLSAVLAWSGISAQLQSLSGLKSHGSVKWSVFAFKRLVHAAYAFGLTLLFWKPAASMTLSVLPAFGVVPHEALQSDQHFSLWNKFPELFQWQVIASIVLTAMFWAISRYIIRRND
ncbi:nucleoside recognition domain-containing protein [Paenibacillus dakarensis]|uniref:nucleoside recognition domain-containing protein n=1 Tax=Paenibacillus dakarensis TaxID=1527293 RepID=UPI0006D5A6A1|nr:nucleoside recognition domain-containing protein [Paenibacillus dakarensis]